MKRISLALIAVCVCWSVNAQEETLTFYQKLERQEKQEREELEIMIENSSEEEYRSYVNGRLAQSMKQDSGDTATVIVDVSDMKHTSSKAKLSTEESLGSLKLKSIFSQAQKRKSTNQKPPRFTVRNKQWAFSNKAKTRHFEQINIEMDDDTAKSLMAHPDVRDIFITSGSDYGSKYSAINTELGRFYPPIETKVYDKEFLRKGNMDQLMESFKAKETTMISVTLRGRPDKDAWKPEPDRRGRQLTDSVLSDIDPKDYSLFSKSSFGFLIETNKEVVQALRTDDRVDMISETSLESLIAQ